MTPKPHIRPIRPLRPIRPIRLIRLIRLTLLPAFLASPATAQHGPSPLAGLDTYVERAMREWNVPGVAIAVVRNDSVIYSRGFGVRELGKPDPVTPNTLFAIGSNTKSFTAAAIGMLVDDRTVRWDDKVTRYLPGFELHDPYVTRELTLRDVLSHRAGLGRRGDWLWIAAQYPRAEILRRIRFLEPNAGFRTELGYQNVMFLAAGEAAGAAAGMSWDDLITSRILTPLGMSTSSTTVRDLPNRPDVATPHGLRDSVLRPIPIRNIDNIAPAGSINSSVAEMTRYLRFILGGGRFEGKELLKPETLRTIQTPHVANPVAPDTLRPSLHFTAYGLGWVLMDYKGRKLAWHNGGIDGFLSEMWTVPDEKLGFVVLTNSDNHSLGPSVAWWIVDQFLGPPARDWHAVNFTRFKTQTAAQQAARRLAENARHGDSKPSHPLDAYAGVYTDSLYGPITVSVRDGALRVTYGAGDFGGTLRHWQFDTFRATWKDPAFGESGITFGLDPAGRVAQLSIEGIATFRRPAP